GASAASLGAGGGGRRLPPRRRRGGVVRRPPLAELRAIGDVGHERVLERVDRMRGDRDETDEVQILQISERSIELARSSDTARLSEQRLVELLADDGRGLQHLLRELAEPVDARGQQRLDGGRKGEPLDRRGQAIGAARTDEGPGADQRLNDLLRENGIAAGALEYRRGQPAERSMRTEQLVQELAGGLGTEWRKSELVVVRSTGPGRSVLRPKIGQQERPGAAHRRRELTDQPVACGIHPS